MFLPENQPTSLPQERADAAPRTSRRTLLKASGATALGVFLGTVGWPILDPIRAQGTQRPISDFINTQGTTTIFTPPADEIGWTTPFSQIPITMALVDYAGKWATWLSTNYGIFLGTTTAGSITERRLADGRAEVHVTLHTTNALTWVVRTNDPGSLPTPHLLTRLFGYSAPEIAGNPTLTRGLAESHLRVVFRNTAPSPLPLPDLVYAFLQGNASPGQEIVSIYFDANATGPLHAAAGLGPDGTLGRCIVGQSGVLMRTQFRGATGDGFPREMVELRRL